MVHVRWSLTARAALADIAEYIRRSSDTYAQATVERLVAATDRLEQFPDLGRVVPEITKATVRELIVGNYRILYRTEVDRVAILTIVHGRQDLRRLDIDAIING